MHAVFEVSELALSAIENIHRVSKVCLKTSLFVLFNATAESVNCSLLKNLETHFCNMTCKKSLSNTLNIYRNIYRKVLSAIIYRLPTSL